MKITSFDIRLNGYLDTLKVTNNLSEREKEVLQWAANGFSNKQIAFQLNICDATVDTHNRSIVSKLNANNMKHAVAIGIRKNIIN